MGHAVLSYTECLSQIERVMQRARTLGLYRTTAQLHAALNEGRSEMWEALPPVTVHFTVGPIEEQSP
jgi:hypothetical protein